MLDRLMGIAAAFMAPAAAAAPETPTRHSAVAPTDAAAILAVLTALYAKYRTGLDGADGSDAALWTAETRALIAENGRLNDGELGAVDADVFIDAQDFGTVKVRSIDVSPRPDGRVAAAVVFDDVSVGVRGHRKTLVMERTRAGWRVYDVMLPRWGMYRDVLLREDRHLRAAGTRRRR